MTEPCYTTPRLTAGWVTLPGDPLRFTGQGRLDVPGGGDGEGLGSGGQGGVETGGGGGGGECLHTVHTVRLPVVTNTRLLRLEVVSTQSGLAGAGQLRTGRESLGWRRRGLLPLPAGSPLPAGGVGARALTGRAGGGRGQATGGPRPQTGGGQEVVPGRAGIVLVIFTIVNTELFTTRVGT